MKTNYQKMGSFTLLILSLIISPNVLAYPFSISKKTGATFPTRIVSGQTATALYTVINKTGSVRAGNYVKYLPPNVTQVTSDPTYPDLCGSTFTLNSFGASGDRCTLEVAISGTVDATDPNPHHHLFVCFPGGITCAGTNDSLNVTGITSAPLATVGLSLDISSNNNMPLAYTSSNGGQNWSLSFPLTLPIGQAQGALNTIYCASNSACITGGESFDGSFNNNLPLIYISSNGGNNWTLSPALSLPSGQTQGEVSGVNCAGNLCAAVGVSFDNSFNNQLPLSYTSNDGGNNWTLSSALSLPSGQTQGMLSNVNCILNKCTVVGTSFDNSFGNQLPMVYTSNDSGNNWTLSSALPLPSGQTQGTLHDITCTSTSCVAAGESFDISGNNNLPLAYTSSDGGLNWTLSSALSLPSGQTQGELSSVTCTGNHCVAVGQSFNNSFGNRLPLVYTSTDGGHHWTLTSNLSLPSGQTQGVLSGVLCTDNGICNAVGQTFDIGFSNRLPLVYISSDAGNNWTLSQALPLPSGQTQGELLGVGAS